MSFKKLTIILSIFLSLILNISSLKKFTFLKNNVEAEAENDNNKKLDTLPSDLLGPTTSAIELKRSYYDSADCSNEIVYELVNEYISAGCSISQRDSNSYKIEYFYQGVGCGYYKKTYYKSLDCSGPSETLAIPLSNIIDGKIQIDGVYPSCKKGWSVTCKAISNLNDNNIIPSYIKEPYVTNSFYLDGVCNANKTVQVSYYKAGRCIDETAITGLFSYIYAQKGIFFITNYKSLKKCKDDTSHLNGRVEDSYNQIGSLGLCSAVPVELPGVTFNTILVEKDADKKKKKEKN